MSFDTWYGNRVTDGVLLVRGFISGREPMMGEWRLFSGQQIDDEFHALWVEVKFLGVRSTEFVYTEDLIKYDDQTYREEWTGIQGEWRRAHRAWLTNKDVCVLTSTSISSEQEMLYGDPRLWMHYFAIRTLLMNSTLNEGTAGTFGAIRATTVMRLNTLIRNAMKPWRDIAPI